MSESASPGVVHEALCRQIAEALGTGTNHVRIRIHQHEHRPVRAVLMAHVKNQWHEQGELAATGDLALLADDMKLLASHGHADDLQVRQAASAEFLDTDLQFRAEWIEAHRGEHLASHLEGRLFRDSRDSGSAARRQIRTPRRGS